MKKTVIDGKEGKKERRRRKGKGERKGKKRKISFRN